MEKAGDVIKDILQEILVQSSEQQMQGVDTNTAMRYMNRYMDELAAAGTEVGYTRVSSTADTINIKAGAMNALIFNTAMRLMNSYDIPASPEFMASARHAEKAAIKIGLVLPKAQMPSTMPLGSGNYYDQCEKFYPGFDDTLDAENQGSILLETGASDE